MWLEELDRIRRETRKEAIDLLKMLANITPGLRDRKEYAELLKILERYCL